MQRLLISAMGGEGGGVLTGWIVAAARASGLAVQATSVPGVAQRTGATAYYIEMAEQDAEGRAPVFALYPVAGQVDILLASELMEAGQAVARGFVTPDRTMLLASSHRVYAMDEKTAMGDARHDPAALRQALTARAKQAVLLDMGALARDHNVPISPVMLGALAGAELLPIAREAFEDAIRAGGRMAEANLAAFNAALAHVQAGDSEQPGPATTAAPQDPNAFPEAARETVRLGTDRLTDYQSKRYAGLYQRRLEPFASGDPELCREVARQLAPRMAFEDVIRVAQLKARPDRFERIRGELGLDEDDPFHVADYLRPGVNEICDVLPWIIARPLLALAARWPWLRRFHIGMRLRGTTIWGYFRLWSLAKLRFVRRLTYRYGVEQKAITHWLALITRAAEQDPPLAQEIAAAARLIKGYGDTAQRGRKSFERILSELAKPILEGTITPPDPATAIADAVANALADPEGAALDGYLAKMAA